MDGRKITSTRTLVIDLTHLGRHVTGIERIAIEQFEKVSFSGTGMITVKSSGIISMIFRQQIFLPLMALLRPHAVFVFPGFPPSPLFTLIPDRTVMYVHDTFLVTRPQDLSTKARLYMAWPFRLAVTRLKHFFVNSEKTKTDLMHLTRPDAAIALYRPAVRNVFNLVPRPAADEGSRNPRALKCVALGTVEPRKNYAAAVAIIDALRARGFTNATLDIIGRAGWGEAAEALSNHPAVRVHGYLPSADVKALIEAADIYLCTSHDEGLGLPLLEVQFAGLPVVAPDAPVFREVLGRSGLFIDANKPAEAADKIASAIADEKWAGESRQSALTNVQRWNGEAEEDGQHAKAAFSTDFNANSRLEQHPIKRASRGRSIDRIKLL